MQESLKNLFLKITTGSNTTLYFGLIGKGLLQLLTWLFKARFYAVSNASEPHKDHLKWNFPIIVEVEYSASQKYKQQQNCEEKKKIRASSP